jgi:hypothetical protein
MTPPNSEDKALTARCTDGKVVVGGGARILGATTSSVGSIPTGVAIVASFPTALTGEPTAEWMAIAKEIVPVSEDWRLSVNVVCARAAD